MRTCSTSPRARAYTLFAWRKRAITLRVRRRLGGVASSWSNTRRNCLDQPAFLIGLQHLGRRSGVCVIWADLTPLLARLRSAEMSLLPSAMAQLCRCCAAASRGREFDRYPLESVARL